MMREAREMKELIQETKETTRDEGGDEDEAKMMTTRWRQQRTIGDDRGDNGDNRGDKAKAKRDDRDNGETQEMKKTTMEEGRIAPSIRDDEGREESHFDAYLYLVQDIYMETKPSTATRVRESEAELAT